MNIRKLRSQHLSQRKKKIKIKSHLSKKCTQDQNSTTAYQILVFRKCITQTVRLFNHHYKDNGSFYLNDTLSVQWLKLGIQFCGIVTYLLSETEK